MPQSLKIRTPYLLWLKDLFPNEQPDIDFYLQNIPRETLISFAIQFNEYHNHHHAGEDVYMFITKFFAGYKIDFQEFISKIKSIERGRQQPVEIIYPNTSLQLFEYAFSHQTKFLNDESYNEAKIYLNIFKAYLSINQNIFEKAQAESNRLSYLQDDRREFIMSLVGSISESDIVNSYPINNFQAQFTKEQYLFLFLKSKPESHILLRNTLKYYNCNTIGELFKLATFLLEPLVSNSHNFINLTKHPNPTKIINFLDKFVLLKIDDSVDYVSLKSNPIIKVSDLIYRVIYSKFVIDKLFTGWFFILKILNENLIDGEKVNRFANFYSVDFIEEFLVEKLLKSNFNKKAIQWSAEKIKEYRHHNKIKKEGEPDYYVRDYQNIYLFECKNYLFSKDVKRSLNYDIIEAYLKERFIENDKKSKKAILQLISNIKLIKSGNLDFDLNFNPVTVNIYPIIIMTDEAYNASGINQLVNEWFIEIIQNERNSNILNFNKVEPLIIITIDTLIYIQPYIKEGRIKFKDLLDSYIFSHLSKSKNKKLGQKNRQISFSTFSKIFIHEKCRSFILENNIFVEGVDELNSDF